MGHREPVGAGCPYNEVPFPGLFALVETNIVSTMYGCLFGCSLWCLCNICLNMSLTVTLCNHDSLMIVVFVIQIVINMSRLQVTLYVRVSFTSWNKHLTNTSPPL